MKKESDKPKVEKLTEEELEELYKRIELSKITTEDAELIKNSIKFSLWIQKKFQEAGITLAKLKKMLFGSKNEKSDKRDDKDDENDKDDQSGNKKSVKSSKAKKKQKGMAR